MKTKLELIKEILETTSNIQENYPELSKFSDEMTITIPDKKTPEINASTLKDYNDSLQAMAKGYANSSTVICSNLDFESGDFTAGIMHESKSIIDGKIVWKKEIYRP